MNVCFLSFPLFAALLANQAMGANLIQGDSSAETESRTVTEGRYGIHAVGLYHNRMADNSTAYDGKTSIKVVSASTNSIMSVENLKKGIKYTFSFYAKSANEGMTGRIYCAADTRPGWVEWPEPAVAKRIFFTRDWQRYTFTFTPEKDGAFTPIYIVNPAKECAVWFDAFQIEEGSVAAKYAQSSKITVGISVSATPGGIFYTGEKLGLCVNALENKKVENPLLDVQIIDYKGRELVKYSKKINFDAQGLYSFKPDFIPPYTGWFRINTSVKDEGKEIASDKLEIVFTPPNAQLSPKLEPFASLCGMYLPPELIKRTGAWWRNTTINFSYSARNEGKFDFPSREKLEKDKRAGLKVKLAINLHPPMRLMSEENKKAMKEYKVSEERFAPDENAMEDWAGFMRELVEKLGDQIDVYDIGGELDARFGLNPYYKNKYPNDILNIFAIGKPAEITARMIRIGSEIIRKKYPDAKICAVSPCDVDSRLGFIYSKEIYKRAPASLNSFGPDCYASPRRIGKNEPVPGPVTDLIIYYKNAQDVLKLTNSKDNSIYIFEYGYDILLDSMKDLEHLRTWASCLAQSHLMARAVGFVSFAYYMPYDFNSNTSTYSIWKDGLPTPAVGAYCHIARFLTNVEKAQYIRFSDTVTAGIYGKTDGTACAAVWSTDPRNSPLAEMNINKTSDIMGMPLKLKTKNGKMFFDVGFEPILFYGNNYETMLKDIKTISLREKQPLEINFRMKDMKTIKVYISNISHIKDETGHFVFNGKKIDFIVPKGEYAVYYLPVDYAPNRKIKLDMFVDSMNQSIPFLYEMPRVNLIPKLEKEMKIDGNMAKWHYLKPMIFETQDLIYPPDVFSWYGKEDLSVHLRMAHDSKFLYVSAEVRDDLHFNKFAGMEISHGDNFQLAIDPLTNSFGRKNLKENDDTNIALALAKGIVSPIYYYGPDKKLFESSEYTINRFENAKITFYELKLSFEKLKINPAKKHIFGLAGVVFDDDSDSKYDYYMTLYSGVACKFDPSKFGLFVLE